MAATQDQKQTAFPTYAESQLASEQFISRYEKMVSIAELICPGKSARPESTHEMWLRLTDTQRETFMGGPLAARVISRVLEQALDVGIKTWSLILDIPFNPDADSDAYTDDQEDLLAWSLNLTEAQYGRFANMA